LNVSVLYFTVLREITGKKEEKLQLGEGQKVTVNIILEKLAALYGNPFADYVYDPQTSQVKGFLQFFINGQSSQAFKGIESELQDGDVLAIVPPVGGG
jgi:MoaD family protein